MRLQNKDIKHPIQKYILSQLITNKYQRFSDLRPPKTDTNLFTYHLNALLKKDYLAKSTHGYTLSLHGMHYTHEQQKNEETAPSITVMVVLQDEYGGTLLRKKSTQPFIDQWMLPTITMQSDQPSLESAARQVLDESIKLSTFVHAGDCYVRVSFANALVTQLVHVFYATTKIIPADENEMIASPHQLPSLSLVPGTSEILARTFFRDPYFFEEFTVDW